MSAGSHEAASGEGFVPLASLLSQISRAKRNNASVRVLRLERDELLTRFRAAHTSGKRVIAFLMAEALVRHDVPPFVWHESLALDSASINQRYDLFLADLVWLRRQYPEHTKVVRYRRCKVLLTGYETIFHREAEFAFFAGKRPAWKLVASLSLSERQMLDCAWLRSAPIKKRAATTEAVSDAVFKALQDDLSRVRRTATFGEAEALATLHRRHALWRCSRMVGAPSPTEIAARYEQMTGSPITRQAAAQQLEKVRTAIRKMEVTMR